MNKIELIILINLIKNSDYMRKVLPFIKKEYFVDEIQQTLFEEIDNFVKKYSQNPTKEILTLEVNKRTDLIGKLTADITKLISDLDYRILDFNWLIDATENWCKERAIYLALTEAIQIADNKNSNKTRDSIPSILQEALSVSFDTHIGHNYIEDAIERYEFLNQQENRVSYGLAMLDKVTGGGAPNKTLTIFLAGPGAGKSLCMCNHAANVLGEGKNVLYITLEMAEEKIAQRIDANLFNLDMNDLIQLNKEKFVDKIAALRKKTSGTLIIKEYPTGSAHAGHFQALLDELKLKKSFVPDIIFIDYLNICISSRFSGKGMNSYSFIKAIAEEIRALAVCHKLPIISATQINREGFNSSDPDMTNTSESFGLPATADFMFAIISTDELEELDQIIIKQLKNRYGDSKFNKKFPIGIDKSKMKLYDLEDSASSNLINFNDIPRDDSTILTKFRESNTKLTEKFGDFTYE